jgi:hypothetical protein
LDGENGGAEFGEKKNYGLTVTVSSDRCTEFWKFSKKGKVEGSLIMVVEAIKIYNCLFYVGTQYFFIDPPHSLNV